MTKTVSVSEMLHQQPNKGDGHTHALTQGEDLYKSAYEAGLARGKEEGYRQGYREGFSDSIRFGKADRIAAAMPDTPTDTSKEAAANRARLKGLPCANCGCPSYNDEMKCPRCGTAKAATIGEPSGAVEELQSRSPRNSQSRSR